MATAKHQAVPLDQIVESPLNPRKHYDKAKLEELAASIKAQGVQQEVKVRPAPSGTGFELVFGHRRLRASKLAGKADIPAVVVDLSDQEVVEAQLVENGQRDDVHPLDEANTYAQLQKKYGVSVEEIAAKVAKDKSYIYKRLKLCALGKAAREAFLEGKLSPAVAYLVARVPENLQPELVGELVPRAEDEGDLTGLAVAARHIQDRYMLQLAQASFDVADPKLVPTAGPCTTCPKRTGNQAELFADVKAKDTCTDPTCFAKKREAGWKVIQATAESKGKRVLNETETKRVFPYDHSNAPAHGSPYVDLKSICYDDPKSRSYGQLIGKVAHVAVARDPHGDVHDLVDRSQIPALLKKAGHDFKAARSSNSGSGDSYAKKQRDAQKKAKRLSDIGAVALAKIARAAANEVQGVWEAIAQVAVDDDYSEKVRAAKACGLDSAEELKKLLSGMPLEELHGVVAVAIMVRHSRVGTYQSGFHDSFKRVCSAAGVDLKALQNESAAAAKKEAAAKSAKKKPAAKKPGAGGVVHFATKDIASGNRCGRDGVLSTTEWKKVTCGHCKTYGKDTFESLAAERAHTGYVAPARTGASACKVAGCSRASAAKGLCTGHYAKAKRLKLNLDELSAAHLVKLAQDGRAAKFEARA